MDELDPAIMRAGFQMSESGPGFQFMPMRQSVKRGAEVPRRFFPFDLLENQRAVLAKNVAPQLQEALETGMQVPFAEMYGYERAPKGSVLGEKFVQPLMKPDVPFGMSRIMPIVNGDPEATQWLYKKAAAAISSAKHPHTEVEVSKILGDLKAVQPRLQMIIPLGLSEGPGYYKPTVVQAFRTAVLLESAVTTPANAAMSVRGQNWRRRGGTAGPRARESEIMRRIGEFTMSYAKGHKGRAFGLSGPQLAEAINMYVNELAPAYRFRSPRNQAAVPLIPGVIGPEGNPILEPLASESEKNLRAIGAYERNRALARETRELTPEQHSTLFTGFLKERMEPREFNILKKALALAHPRIAEYTPDERIRAIMSEIRSNKELARHRESILEQYERFLESGTPTDARKPGLKRLTTAMEGANILDERAAQKAARKAIKETAPIVGKGPKNMPLIMALAAVLSAGMFAAGIGTEEAA